MIPVRVNHRVHENPFRHKPLDSIMSSLRYKSFCLGILLTSLTWLVALYLYTNLTDTSVKLDLPSETVSHKRLKPEKIVSDNVPAKYKKNNENMIMLGDSKERNTYNKHVQGKLQNSKLDVDQRESNRIPPLDKRKGEGAIIEGAIIEGRDSKSDDMGLVRSPEDHKTREEGYRKHAFNLLVCNRLGYHRSIPDTRNQLCKEVEYEEKLPTASVIICFFNEAFTALLRTVHSVLDRTPEHLLHEILLVDDASANEDLKSKLEDYITDNLSPKVKLIHTEKREGLIRARMFGAQYSSGQVLVFLDSHCEVNKKWLEPLLTRIAKNRSTVVCPIIDIINADTFVYTASPIVRGGFNWGLHFRWDSLPANTLGSREDFIKPIVSPTMAGGLFAIDRTYFKEMGEYDPGMDIWGGENLEISFRVWMCGGKLEIIPCSRVGHIFRQRRPYGSPTGEDTVMHNSLRVAHVWMDEFKENYFKLRPDARTRPYGNITDRVELRKRLKCKSFAWYLKNIYPELKPPNPMATKEKLLALKNKLANRAAEYKSRKRYSQTIVDKYAIRLKDTDLCVESEKEVTKKGSLLMLRKCQRVKSQMWFETDKQELLLAELLCLDVVDDTPRLAKCHEMGGPQEWRHKSQVSTQIYNLAAGTCLGVKQHREEEHLVMELCTASEPTVWDLELFGVDH